MAAPILYLLCGVAVGYLSLGSLRWIVDRYVRGQSASLVLGLQMLRLSALAAVLLVFAKAGAESLLAGAAGMLLSRIWLVRGQAARA